MTRKRGRTPLLTTLPLVLGSAAVTLAPTATPGTATTSEASASATVPSSSATTTRRLAPLTGQWRMTSLQVMTDGAPEEVPYSGELVVTPVDPAEGFRVTYERVR